MAEDNDKGGSGRPPKNYKVGYGCPPEEHRFRKGAPSPNPYGCRGKPKPGTLAAGGLKGFLDEKTWVTVDGKRKRVTLREAMNYALYAFGASGKVQAFRYLDQRCAAQEQRQAERLLAEIKSELEDSATAQKIIDRAVRRAMRKAHRASESAVTDEEAGDE